MRLGSHDKQRWNEGLEAALQANSAFDRMIAARGENGSPTIKSVEESVSFLIHDRQAGELIGRDNIPDEKALKFSKAKLSLRGLNVVAGMGKEIYRGYDTGSWPSVEAPIDSQSPEETVKIPT